MKTLDFIVSFQTNIIETIGKRYFMRLFCC